MEGPGRGARSTGRAERLRGARFQALFRQPGRRDERPSFLALWNVGEGGAEVGFAVGRRLGGAVVRNRARRRLREAYRQHRDRVPPGVQLVFVGRPPVLTRPFPEIVEDMRQTLDRVARSATPAGKQRSIGPTG